MLGLAGRGLVRTADSDIAMHSLIIPYPAFDPVLIHLGPFAVRWYALAYIFGILIGWAYARVLIRSPNLWGGKAPMTVADFDDFILWVTLGIILGGRIGYVLFYNLPHKATLKQPARYHNIILRHNSMRRGPACQV